MYPHFKIINFTTINGVSGDNITLKIKAILNVDPLYLFNYESYEGTTYDVLTTLATDMDLGFASNIAGTNDEMIWVIREFEKELLTWEIQLADLVKLSPKSQKNKVKLQNMARFLYEHKELNGQIRKNKRLPIQILENQFKVNRKKIERRRIYILACFILLDDRYFYINDYVK